MASCAAAGCSILSPRGDARSPQPRVGLDGSGRAKLLPTACGSVGIAIPARRDAHLLGIGTAVSCIRVRSTMQRRALTSVVSARHDTANIDAQPR